MVLARLVMICVSSLLTQVAATGILRGRRRGLQPPPPAKAAPAPKGDASPRDLKGFGKYTEGHKPAATSEDWFKQQTDSIDEDCREKHDRLKEKQRKKLELKIRTLEEELKGAEGQIKLKEAGLAKVEADEAAGKGLVSMKKEELQRKRAEIDVAKGAVQKKQEELQKMQAIVDEKLRCVQELKEAQGSASSARQQLAHARSRARHSEQIVNATRTEFDRAQSDLAGHEQAAIDAADDLKQTSAQVAEKRGELERAREELAEAKSGSIRLTDCLDAVLALVLIQTMALLSF